MKLVSFSGDPGSSKRLGSQRPRYRRVLHLNYICIWHFSSNFTCVLEAGCSLVPACLFAFSHCCININPAVFSSRWRKSMGFLFLYLKWQEGHFFFFFPGTIDILYFYFLVNLCLLDAERCPIFHPVWVLPGRASPLPWPLLDEAAEQWSSRSGVFVIKFYHQWFVPS